MSEFDGYDDNDDLDEQEQGKQPADLRKLIKERDKQLKSALAELEKFRKEQTQQSLTKSLAGRGIEDARAAQFILASGVDVSKQDDVDAWLKANGDLFGVVEQKDTTEADNTANEWAKQASLQTSGSGGGDAQDVLARIKNAKTPEELTAFLATQRVKI